VTIKIKFPKCWTPKEDLPPALAAQLKTGEIKAALPKVDEKASGGDQQINDHHQQENDEAQSNHQG